MFPLRHTVARRGLCTRDKSFCCRGCLTVFELLTENGLGDFYRFGKAAGVRAKAMPKQEEFGYLDDPALRRRLVDFADERVTRVTFRVPSVHCIACVWLLGKSVPAQSGHRLLPRQFSAQGSLHHL